MKPALLSRASGEPLERLRMELCGRVQGVGLRPAVFRLARAEGLAGWVANTGAGVAIEVEGPAEALARFSEALRRHLPPLARIDSLRSVRLSPGALGPFEIRKSESGGAIRALAPADVATCAACVAEVFDSTSRRYRYPFTTCSVCGPRFSILERLPFDRATTTMRAFALCGACRAEYADPADRRFHAQTIACPACGPRLALLSPEGRRLARDEEALAAAVRALCEGRIVAVKGLGGFQLLADAANDEAVALLRARKRRPAKPFALMAPDLATAEALCEVSPAERALLSSPEAPIVLLRRKSPAPGAPDIAASVAPGLATLGVMLAYSRLHHLLLSSVARPIVATSGNRSGEPIAIAEEEALARLADIADLFLVHDRPIARALDDSVAQVVAGNGMVLRLARGYAPASFAAPREGAPVLAAGGHLKAAVALALEDRILLGPHIGDLDTEEARSAFRRACADLPQLHAAEPAAVVCDSHPDYYASRHAATLGKPLSAIQHHRAHAFACVAEHRLEGEALAIAFDGTGYGDDATVWGGELLAIRGLEASRAGHLRAFALPGGERAVREPRRAALGVLHELFGEATFGMRSLAPLAAFGEEERRILAQALERGVNAPRTTSAGRLFDAVASLLGLRQRATFEAEAAIALEHAALGARDPVLLEFALRIEKERLVLDWEPVVRSLLAGLAKGRAPADLAAGFHRALARAIACAARALGSRRVLLCGGCFQNRLLCELTLEELERAGIEAFLPHRAPPGDGGLALGQAWWARASAGGTR
ncbi:MAG: carbamoyltransferase HypF [Burkholderiales bacterium]|nr:carbamoyltransferase HypF [Burkholderiales bacterium]